MLRLDATTKKRFDGKLFKFKKFSSKQAFFIIDILSSRIKVHKQKKTSNFFLFSRFYTGRKNFINKKGLFYAKFFEFEEFSIEPFFCSSIQPQHTVKGHRDKKIYLSRDKGTTGRPVPVFPGTSRPVETLLVTN